ncbi:MAG: hypothetical protein A3C80_03355 [Candidatus Ryanbacteria bacterium RIFCSPHIGHO2_02_FULL_45_43]|uniref:Type 4 fimbrial biogenesis protein PilX N-terminal domain-containing protein n=1 Tax=Candidatus Ryanbacteria bacterium RIFCSPHIGHO2_01_45_13 TaxID=1802112 RepID=A0A1G2FUQ8_9BACT|nr:MAG: hypothetical protein A2W41_01295 [Candidatus Ryanbacteria bacterium RIFCSPHIGHO2_01_45_13]OGZ41500.1 MAG: hypothetical protein A2718_03620 [Candidatus Ryanbacteria bacterium RIFCSPHIGHO2_01_FULL_44_130]OGZ47967.1 MAG: hypothetical protein A3C80_03355 [Candidatus Ryanbacteria bacterium RIFCSPHIGHO2_02_FULL_45_43]OGZ50103.1 MAG: hypothetical protein A3E55_01220 [Candidatus Ryanbacteria bacterium RIFCSPHIGHO2_12_FULL_44_20]OGZ51105.1 MAG: hypothetical protein A3A17_03660 [Candidatus Ryanba
MFLTKKRKKRKGQKAGFTLLYSLIITSIILVINAGIFSIIIKETQFAGLGRESQFAYYAAESGAECAFYWDAKQSSFDSPHTITCNQDSNNPSNSFAVGNSSISTFTITFLPKSYCTEVKVNKSNPVKTVIESRGYNTCDTSANRIERGVRIEY